MLGKTVADILAYGSAPVKVHRALNAVWKEKVRCASRSAVIIGIDFVEIARAGRQTHDRRRQQSFRFERMYDAFHAENQLG
jgi:hypothetical protein